MYAEYLLGVRFATAEQYLDRCYEIECKLRAQHVLGGLCPCFLFKDGVA